MNARSPSAKLIWVHIIIVQLLALKNREMFPHICTAINTCSTTVPIWIISRQCNRADIKLITLNLAWTSYLYLIRSNESDYFPWISWSACFTKKPDPPELYHVTYISGHVGGLHQNMSLHNDRFNNCAKCETVILSNEGPKAPSWWYGGFARWAVVKHYCATTYNQPTWPLI